MRQVDYKRFLSGDDFEAWCDDAQQARNQLLEAVEAGEKPEPDDRIWKKLKADFLIAGNYRKCMYCESKTRKYGEDAEHFRPKGAVTENRQKIASHPGYYWLAYEWQNLLLSCAECNRDGKKNEFPIAGTRVNAPNPDPSQWWHELQKEEPLLLHPYCDNPKEHFDAGKYGVLYGKTERGKVTIKVCKLNRPELKTARRQAEEILANRLKRLIDRFMDNEALDDEIFGAEDEFSLYLNRRASQVFQRLHEKYR